MIVKYINNNNNSIVCKTIAELLDVKSEDLINSLTYRTVIDKNKNSDQKNIKVPLNLQKVE